MNVMAAPPEVPPELPPEKLPTERGRTAYRVLLFVLLASLLLLTLVFVFPLLINLRNQHLISSFWSGYTVASDLNYPQPSVTSVNGSWTVPTVNVSVGNSFSVAWIGIGGQFDSTLIQAGTEQDSTRGQGTYSAWYELLNESVVTIDSLNIMPGDRITASISLLVPTNSIWSIEIHDVTNEQSFQKNVFYDSSMLSAEWIVERPTINNRLATLADFGQVTFTGCTATISGTIGTVSSFPHIQVIMYNLQNTQLVSVSTLTSNGSSFTLNYVD
ncbi:MAG: G1 family glutamic endopeptidase [Candidatus Bathyarchaeia archaeon]